MFRYNFSKLENNDLIIKNQPKIIQISKSHDSFQWTTPYHLHKDHIEIAYIEKGIAHYNIDGHSVTAKKGDLLVIEAGLLHSTISSTENPTDIWVIYASDFQFRHLEPGELLIDKNFIILNTNEHSDFIFSIYKEIALAYEKDIPNTYNICQNLLSALLILIYNIQNKAEFIPTNSDLNLINKIMHYLNENFLDQDTLSLTDLAKLFNVSTSYISHGFAKEYGVSPINYIIDRKMCEARWLLRSSNMSLTGIADYLGYSNVNHFANLFNKRIGCPPLRYRELYYDDSNKS